MSDPRTIPSDAGPAASDTTQPSTKRRAGKPRAKHWFLEGFLDQAHSLRRLSINAFPYRIGRQQGLELRLSSAEISRLHAQLERRNNELVIRDLGSTNGTFVNHEPVVDEAVLREGDIIHLGAVEMRLVAMEADQVKASDTTRHDSAPLSDKLPIGTRELQELLLQDQVTALFQPIFTSGGELHGWEVLGRGDHPALPVKPLELFRIAESIGTEVMLSNTFRRVGVALAAKTNPDGLYFINTHPRETENLSLFTQTLETLRGEYPALQLVLELHEAAFTDLAVLKQLGAALKALNVQLAFDDFGAGQARLVELAETPPDYIKLDISLVRNIDRARPARREMVELVLEVAHRAGARVVAEGVSRSGEADTCRRLGFDLLQGWHLGSPQAAENLKPG